MSDDDPYGQRLREVLSAQAERVHPAGDGLARIRERTARPARAPWWRPALALGAAAAVAATGFGVGVLVDDDGPPPSVAGRPATESALPSTEPTPRGTPSGAPTPTPTSTASEPAGEPSPPEAMPPPRDQPSRPGAELAAVPVYFVADQPGGPRLFREFHARSVTVDPVRAALAAMLAGDPVDEDYRSLWPASATVDDVTVSGEVATVELSAGPAVEGPEEELALQQLVYTVTASDNDVRQVRVLVDGVPVGDDLMARAPRLDVEGLLWLLAPTDGAVVPATFTLSGEAAAYEGTVTWQAIDPSGAVVEEGFTTAAEGQRKSAFSTEVTLPPGEYVLRVLDPGGSGDTARAPYDTKQVTVR